MKSAAHDSGSPAVVHAKRSPILVACVSAGLTLAGAGTTGMSSATGLAAGSQVSPRRAVPPAPAGFVSQFLKVGDLTFHYVEGGSGPVVVLLHGWPQTWWAWRKVMPRLATRYHVIAIDTPGLGASDIPTTGYEKRRLADDIHGLMAALGHDRIVLVGHDLGAAIAYAYAGQYPREVVKLAVMDDPIPGLADWDDVKGKWPRWHFAFNALPDLPEALVAGRELTYLSWFYHNAFQKDAISDADAQIYAASYAQPGSLHAGFEYYRAFVRDAEANRADANSLIMPVLALGGDHSPWKSYLYDQLRARATSIEGVVVPDCGHFIPEEQPAWLSDRLMLFIDGY